MYIEYNAFIVNITLHHSEYKMYVSIPKFIEDEKLIKEEIEKKVYNHMQNLMRITYRLREDI